MIYIHAVEVDLIFQIHWVLNISRFSSRIIQSVAELYFWEAHEFFHSLPENILQIHLLKEMHICVAINAYCLPNMHKKICLLLYRLLLFPLSRTFFPDLSALYLFLITWVLAQMSSSQKGLDRIPYQKDPTLSPIPPAIFLLISLT